MGIVKVNKTDKKISIFDAVGSTGNIIGTLYPNEVFTWINEWNGTEASGYPSQQILFRNSSGTISRGWIHIAQGEPGMDKNICGLAKFTKIINGKTYYGFEMRRSEELYNTSARMLNISAGAGMRILCESSTSGATHPEWLAVHYIETGKGTGEYRQVVPQSYGFVDIGYDKGSTFTSNCSLIGSL